MSSPVHTVVDARRLDPGQLRSLVRSLLSQTDRIEVRGHEEIVRTLSAREPRVVTLDGTGTRPRTGYVLAIGAPVVLAAGSVAALVARAEVAGRVVTRVFLPGGDDETVVALWSAAWLDRQAPADLDVTAVAAVDRELLPHDHPQVRAWVPCDEVGVAWSRDLGDDAARWARRTGRRLTTGRLLGAARSRAGVLRRSWRLSRQRAAHRPADPGAGSQVR